MHIFSWIILGVAAGWVTGRVLKGNQYGPWVDIIMGIAGALGGGFLIQYSFPERNEVVSTALSAILGAVALTVITASVNGRKRYA